MEQMDRSQMKRNGIDKYCATCGKVLDLRFESTQKINVHEGRAYCGVCACEKNRILESSD